MNPKIFTPLASLEGPARVRRYAEAAAKAIQEHAEADFPNECCGFLYAKSGETSEISVAVPARNAQEGDQRKRFIIDPRDYLKAEHFAQEQGLELAGIYHSHPDHPAEPSIHDLRQAMPVFSYLILSVQQGAADHARSWTLNENGTFEEESIHFPL